MSWTDVFAHWLHVTAAVLWVGGSLVFALVVQPVLRRRLEERQRMEVYALFGRRLNFFQWVTWGVLLLTGVWKLRFGIPMSGVLITKLVLVAVMVVLSLQHSLVWGPALVSQETSDVQRAALTERAAFWGKINAVLLLAILFCGVLLTVRP